MKSSPKLLVDSFLGQEHIALAGYSHSSKKFGHTVYQTLKEKGYVIHPVNPCGGTAPGGEVVHQDLDSLPPEVEALLIVTRPGVTERLVDQAAERGVRILWIQQMSGSKAVRDKLEEKGLDAVYNRCILLHANPTGIHKLHQSILKLFGRLPLKA